MATLVEFLQPVAKGSNRDRCLAVLLFAKRHEGLDGLRAGEISKRLISARAPQARKVNVADVMSKAGHHVDGESIGGGAGKLWRLTETGEVYVAEKLGVTANSSSVADEVSVLAHLVANITDEVVRDYVVESLTCLAAGALRAAVVFLWTGAVRRLQETALARHGGTAISAALLKHDPKSRGVTSVDSFSAVRDAVFLQAIRDLGDIDKGEWATLVEALNLRNRCGHPTKYRPGAKKVASFVEDVVGICF